MVTQYRRFDYGEIFQFCVLILLISYQHNVVKAFLKSDLNSYEKVAKSQDLVSFKLHLPEI